MSREIPDDSELWAEINNIIETSVQKHVAEERERMLKSPEYAYLKQYIEQHSKERLF